ncbi:hypothetical protein LTS10_003716 [Elasticomyces elasticus]|nr:hypothetical protein LTS10_003716 [Elasticomyces elasticus]
MRTQSMIVQAALAVATANAAVLIPPPPPPSNVALQRRQQDPDSTCSVFGIDFQGGGSYFINSASNENFTFVSEFEGCNNDTASVLLVNNQSSDEYECSIIPTTPDDVSMLSSCPIMKSQLSSGSWSILTLGNNGNGNPFNYQRDFTLEVGAQQVVTTTVYVPYTMTVQSVATVESTSTVTTTSGIPNSLTYSSATTNIATVTPPTTTISTVEVITRTFTRWTKTASSEYVLVVAPSCTIPSRPDYADPWARMTPTLLPLPAGIQPQQPISAKGEATVTTSASVCQGRSCKRVSGRDLEQKRAPDEATVTSTRTMPNNTTLTVTVDASTTTNAIIITNTVYTSLPPQTVYGTAFSTVTAPAPIQAIAEQSYTRAYATRTMLVVWTNRVTTTPTAAATKCRSAGGHYGNGFVLP